MPDNGRHWNAVHRCACMIGSRDAAQAISANLTDSTADNERTTVAQQGSASLNDLLEAAIDTGLRRPQ